MTMRIAMLAPIAWRVPPRHYGPWERVVSLLTEGLVRRGLAVTLFATADSVTDATLSAVCPRPYEEDASLDAKVWEALHIASVFERAGEFDLIHNHFDFLPLTYSRLVETPLVTTIHGFSSARILPAYAAYDRHTHYVSISDADRDPGLHYAATVHHGIPLDEFTFRETPGDYLLFFGRIHPDKGVVAAIDAAERAGRRLRIAGIVQDERYFEEAVKPRLGRMIEYIGSVGPADRDRVLGGAEALLHLIDFDEPFGLSMIEAMACGTPVVAYRRGSIPEVVRNGETGFIVADVEGAVAAIEAVGRLDRAAIRRHVADNFSVERMVDGYIAVYEGILSGRIAPT